MAAMCLTTLAYMQDSMAVDDGMAVDNRTGPRHPCMHTIIMDSPVELLYLYRSPSFGANSVTRDTDLQCPSPAYPV